ncbi:MAG: hypothetical protein HY599_06755 [Candidatus Omnitrophica bacterium]|nr:hypothetical protein [Candidatus Omnitrophota bacterium]
MRRLLAPVLALGTAAVLLAVGLPHRHSHNASASHPAQSCRVCKVQETFSATPPSAAIRHALPMPVVCWALTPSPAFHASAVLSSASPRAPPVLS